MFEIGNPTTGGGYWSCEVRRDGFLYCSVNWVLTEEIARNRAKDIADALNRALEVGHIEQTNTECWWHVTRWLKAGTKPEFVGYVKAKANLKAAKKAAVEKFGITDSDEESRLRFSRMMGEPEIGAEAV